MVAAAFSDPVMAAQAAFRAVLDATARPGKIITVTQPLAAPAPLAPAAAAIALTLCDHDTQVWLDAGLAASSAATEWLRFHTSARIAEDAANAVFAFVADAAALPPLDRFNPGTLEYPDRSTTIVMQVDSLAAGVELMLSGPGISGQCSARIAGLPADMSERLAANRRLFPRGIDLLLVCGADVMALPRTTQVHGDT